MKDDLPPLPYNEFLMESEREAFRKYIQDVIAPYKDEIAVHKRRLDEKMEDCLRWKAENTKLRELLVEAKKFVPTKHVPSNYDLLKRIEAALGEQATKAVPATLRYVLCSRCPHPFGCIGQCERVASDD